MKNTGETTGNRIESVETIEKLRHEASVHSLGLLAIVNLALDSGQVQQKRDDQAIDLYSIFAVFRSELEVIQEKLDEMENSTLKLSVKERRT